MIGRIVITSVPRGLDGGTGFQTVSRTRGLRPSIAERLATRAAYPHPFPGGDPRNPHVLVHRIELVGDRTIHVLGSARDARGSYTGRSNSLAELVAIAPEETRGLPGGPAFAVRTFPWLTAWAGDPREMPLGDEPAVPGHDPGDPEATGHPVRCPAWEHMTGDAGWAGELAKSFLDGRRALLWAGEGVDVAELFTEALRLLPASLRWQVTFNTCEIEPFPAHWRAVRPELGLVGNYQPANELRLVLGRIRENGSRAPDHALSRRARGEAPADDRPPPRTGSEPAAASSSIDEAALRSRLQEITEERRRRMGAVGGGPTQPGHRARCRPSVATLVLGGLFLCGLAAIAVAVIVIRRPDLFVASLDTDALRSADESNDVAPPEPSTTWDDEDVPPPGPALPQQAEVPAPSAPAPTPDAPAPAPSQTAGNGPDADTLRRRKQAIADLAADDVQWVSLLPLTSSFDPSPPPPQPITLCSSFDLDGLLEPGLELASPYNGPDRLLVAAAPSAAGSEKTWNISGFPPLDPTGERGSETQLGTIVARSGTLSLQLAPNIEPVHDLFRRLQNSLLLISTKDAERGDRAVRRRIGFADRIRVAEFFVDPLDLNDKIIKNLPSSVLQRLEDVPTHAIDWAIDLKHPSLDQPKTLTHDCKAITLRLPNPPAGTIELIYSKPQTTIDFKKTRTNLQISITFTSTGTSTQIHLNRSLSPPHPRLLKVLSCKNLKALRENPEDQDNVLDYLTRVLREQLTRVLREQEDPYEHLLDLEHKKLLFERDQMLIPAGRPGGTMASNDDSRTQYDDKKRNLETQIRDKAKELADRRFARNAIVRDDADEILRSLRAHGESLQPFECSVRCVQIVATDEKLNKYLIPIAIPRLR
jgi:hypothetical protein